MLKAGNFDAFALKKRIRTCFGGRQTDFWRSPINLLTTAV